ncbi:MAG TPA: hypothetical protein VGI43_12355 [Mucilaginibacter sp.]|jgi:hypothetical protein
MSDEIIVQQLKDKEAHLINELNKVRLALKAFIDENMGFGNANFQRNFIEDLIPRAYASNLTYNSKILFLLNSWDKPMLVDDIVSEIHEREPELNISTLHKNVSYNLSMLAKYSKIRKHPFNRKIKYSL